MKNLKQRVADLLDDDNKSTPSRVVDAIIITTIIITVVSIILESEPALHEQFKPTFIAIEYFSLFVFSVEYLMRVWSAPESPKLKYQTPRKARISYIFSFHAIIDLLAILPMFLSLFSIDLRFVRMVRLLRVFKLTRYNSAMTTLLSVIKKEANALFSIMFVIVIIVTIASSCIYLLEHQAQPESFGSILKSMWWSIVTLSTVGYGDVSPVTPMGKLFGGVIMLAGIGLVALPAGLLASAFSEQLHKNRYDYMTAIRRALEDGVISAEEHRLLKQLQEKYDISEEDAESMIQEQLTFANQRITNKAKEHNCPHCGKSFVE